MDTREIIALGREHADLNGLRGWTVKNDTRAQTRGGQCRFRKREIGLTCSLLADWPYAEVLDVILHEIAHAKVGPGHGHGAKWKAMAEQVGAVPKRCYPQGLPGPEQKWVGQCIEGHEHTRLRCPGEVLYCRRGECSSKTGERVLRVIDWHHVDTDKRPTGKGYAKWFRSDWDKYREAYASGDLPALFGSPEDPFHAMADDEDDLDDHFFLLDWENGRIEPLTPEKQDA